MGCELGNLTSWAPLSCYIVSLQWPQLTPHQTSLNTASEKYGKRYLLWFFSFLVSLTNISSQLHTCGKEGTETLNGILSADLLWLCFDVHNPCNNHIYMNFQENVFSQWWQISEFHHRPGAALMWRTHVTLALQTHATPTIWQLFRLGVLSVLCHPGVALIVQFQKVPPAIQSRWSHSLNRKYGITIQQKVWDYTFNKRLASFRLWVPTWLCQCTSIMLEAYIGWLILRFRPKDFSF